MGERIVEVILPSYVIFLRVAFYFEDKVEENAPRFFREK